MARPFGQVRSVLAGWRHRPLRTVGYAAFALLLTALVTMGTVYYQRAHAVTELNGSRQAALNTARQVAAALTNVDAKSVDRDVERLMRGTTGDFKRQFGRQSQAFRQVITKDRVSSSGTVTEAALSRMEGNSAVALTAVQAKVRNAASPEGQQRQYRFRLTLQRKADKWLVSNLEFVS